MVRAELMGGHTHTTLDGVRVHVWKRGPKYLARGRFQGQPFGETLGESETEAGARLRHILTEIESSSYVRPSQARKRPLSGGRAPRLTLRQVMGDFLAEKRKLCGKQTAGDYRARLMPVLDFAEQPANRQRWPLAADADRAFVVSLRAFLFRHQTTRNGRPGGRPKLLSPRQVHNVLQCLRTLFAWASNPAVRKLPAGWANPLTRDLVGSPAAKDPLREDLLPLDVRARLAGLMDAWQLCHLGPSLVLPLRPDEATGLLVGDVDFRRGWLEFGHRFGDANFTKEATAFRLPFPGQLGPIYRACIQGRAEGPLLRSRRAFRDPGRAAVPSPEELRRRYEELLLRQPRDGVQAAHDRKLLFRRLLRQLGGVSEDSMAREFKKVLAAAGVTNGATLYTLRGSVTTAMQGANLPHLEMRYLTSHSTNDILNVYATLDPVGAMRKYFDTIRPLLDAIADRARALGLSGG
jgi:integrase